MNISIFLVVDDEDDRFILSLAFARMGLLQCISFFFSRTALLNKLQQLSTQKYPNLIGMNYQVPVDKRTDLRVSLKNHTQWNRIPVVLFCQNAAPFIRQKLMDEGAVACLDKASHYVDYMELARRLLTLTALNTVGTEKYI